MDEKVSNLYNFMKWLIFITLKFGKKLILIFLFIFKYYAFYILLMGYTRDDNELNNFFYCILKIRK